MATGQTTQSFGPWTARSQGPTRSACSSDRGIHTETADALHEHEAKMTEPSQDKGMTTLTRSKTTAADFMLASSKTAGGGGSSEEPRHDPKAQRDRMTLFKRQLAANRTRGTDEVMKRNRGHPGIGTGTSSHVRCGGRGGGGLQAASKNSFVARSVMEALRDERSAGGGGAAEGHGMMMPGLGGGGGGGGGGDEGTVPPIAPEDWPFVYFVVALDQMPVATKDCADHKVGKPHTARERQRFLAARKRRIQQSREELERIRESNIDMGLRLEPIRPATRSTPGGGGSLHHATPLHHPNPDQAARQGMMNSTSIISSHKHPPTPNSSEESSRDFPMHRGGEYFLNNGEQLSMEEMMCRGFTQWFSDNISTASNSQPGSRPGGEIMAVEGSGLGIGGGGGGGKAGEKPDEPFSSSNPNDASGGANSSSVQLPDILAAEQGKKRGPGKNRDPRGHGSLPNSAPGSLQGATTTTANNNNNKKVHFAEGLPYIKGSGLQVPPPQPKQEPDPASTRPLTTPYVTSARGDSVDFATMLRPPWTAPVTSRPLPAMTPKSKNFRPLPMPKIDIVSEIYDELIVKTIQSFLAREGYSAAKFAHFRKKIMARLSATYPHLAAHRAWKGSHHHQETSGNHHHHHAADGQGPLATDTDEGSRGLRLRPLHQGFFAKDPKLDLGATAGDLSRESSFLGHLQLPPPPHSSRQAGEFIRPRWVPVLPSYRSCTSLRPEDDEAYTGTTFMAIDGRHIAFTPREDLAFKAATLPGATSDFRMGPLTLPSEDGGSNKPAQAWTHMIPSAIDE